jgi:hypothetical protein
MATSSSFRDGSGPFGPATAAELVAWLYQDVTLGGELRVRTERRGRHSCRITWSLSGNSQPGCLHRAFLVGAEVAKQETSTATPGLPRAHAAPPQVIRLGEQAWELLDERLADVLADVPRPQVRAPAAPSCVPHDSLNRGTLAGCRSSWLSS